VVGGVGAASQQTLLDGAVDELDSTVVLEQHARGDVGNGGVELFGHAPYTLQELVLLGADSRRIRGEAGEVQEFSQLKTEFRQPPHLCAAERGRFLRSRMPLSVAGLGIGSVDFR